MKLWFKITVAVTVLTILVLGGCLYYFSSSQAAYTLSSMEESELKMLDLFCINLSAIEKLSSIDTNRETVINSAVHYAFMAQARSLNSETVSYGLETEGTLYSDNCPYNPKDLLQLDDNQSRAWTTRVINGTYIFVASTRISLFNHPYIIYLVRDATSVFERIDALRRIALLLLITGMLLLTVLLPIIVKRALHPLKELSETAQKIALGNYSLRAHIDNTSEIGDMGKQFNLMADALEKKIEQLSEIAQNRTVMLGALTHELKTPLTAIIGYADTYLHVPIDEAKKDYCVEQIFLAGQRTERLSQKLLQIISLEQSFTGQMHPINAGELIDSVRIATDKSLHATLLSYMPADSEASVKVVRRAILNTTPYRCAFDIFLLVQQYMLLLSMIQLAATILKSRKTGVLIVLVLNLIGYVLTPSRLMLWLQLEGQLQFIANLLSVWLSPLQHATYAMHTFGYDSLPSLFVSNVLMLCLSLAFCGASLLLFRGYQFNFSGGDGNA